MADMDVDMDIDMDLDLGPDPETAALEADSMRLDPQSGFQSSGINYAPTFPVAPEEQELAPTKVHLRGTENLSTGDIERWISQYFPEPRHKRLEWIDDSSLNVLYDNSETALHALHAFTLVDGYDASSLSPSQLRPAKRLSTHPDVELGVRQAFVSDQKQRNARLASKFYLMNPEQDPNETRRRHREHRERRRRYSDDREEYTRRRYDDREHRRRRGQDDFDVSMYDDATGDTSRARRRGSYSGYSSSEDGRRRRISGRGRARDDLFSTRPGRGDGRLRDRSASPRGEGDGRHGFAETEVAIDSPPQPAPEPEPGTVAWSISNIGKNIGKELFPNAPNPSALSPGNSNRELFPQKMDARRSRELFPHKTAISNHRRSDALDADETAHLMHIGIAHAPTRGGDRDATARMLEGGEPWDTGIRIRGMATERDQEPGLSVKGAANRGNDGGAVKELFPIKTGGGVGKELFSDKMSSNDRGRRNGDMFY